MSAVATRQLCTFWIDKQLFGVDVTDVQEVMRAQHMTRVPLAPNTVRGLIHLRGQIVTALDMRARLSLPALEGRAPMNVLVRDSDGVLSLLVDDIGDVLDVPESAFERTPDTMPQTLKELVSGVYKLDRQLLLLVDVERITAPTKESGENTHVSNR